MNQMGLYPTDKAGEFVIAATGEKVQLLKFREGDVFDTAHKAAGAITAGTKLDFFTVPTTKGLQHANLTTARRITSGTEMIINRIGVLPCQAVGNVITKGADITKSAYAGVLTFKLGRERVIAEGPLVTFPSGYGVTGSTTENDSCYLSFGVPSAAAAPSLLVPQKINEKDDLHAYITFPEVSWITGANMPTLAGEMAWMLFVHGLITESLR